MPSVQIVSPATSEKLYVGTTYNIQWTSSGATTQRVQYSIDGGNNFNPIQTGLGPNVQQFAWSIPGGIVPDGQTSVAAIVRIVVRDVNGVEATSASNVTIANTEIASISPTRGPVAGNTLVNISGKGFAPGCNVKFGNSDGLNVQVLGSTQIQASTPSGIAGPTDVKVKNTGVPGATLPNGFTYDPPAGPTISSVNPNRGPIAGNTPVTIIGANFDQQVNVKFSDFDAVITQKSATQLIVNSPAAIAAGAVQLKVKNPNLPAAIGTFTYDPPVGPTISSVNPNRGPIAGNTPVTILGANFDPQVNVKFGDLDAVITQKSATQLVVNSPAAIAAGAVQLKVKNPVVQAAIATFTYDPPSAPAGPIISSINPVRGPIAGNTEVSIFGMNFDPQVNVKFGALDGTITQKSATLIKVKSPAVAAAGAVELKVKNPNLQAVSTTFTYDPPPPPPPPQVPMISSIDPTRGPTAGNTPVTILGSNFDPQVNVKFGEIDGVITQKSANLIVVKSPAVAAPITVQLKVKNPAMAAATAIFTYDPPPPPPPPQVPMISSIDPTRGPIAGNTPVTILGANFDPQVNVKFGDLDGVITQKSANLIVVKSPAISTPGAVQLKVKNPNAQAAIATFTYDPPPPPPGSPRIDNLNPPEGPATRSISVVITGVNFVRDCNVRFGGVDARRVTFDNPGQLTVETPTDVPAGLARVRVVNPDQTSAARENGFKFNGPPTITRIDPPEGPREGGISVNVLGMNFKPGASVRFGDVIGTTLQVNPDGTSITCMLPPGQKGAVAVKVDNPAPDLQRGSLDAAFTYLGPQQEVAARIFSISPKTVLLDTDTKITVKGRNLATAMRQGVFAVRGPNQSFATIQMSGLQVSTSEAMQEDTVTFFLKFSRVGGLSLQQRVPYYVVASVRPESRADRLFETSRNGQFTLITNSSPVAFGVTGQVIDGAANMILLSGRGLKGSKVAVVDSSGKSLPVDYVNDREDLLVVGLTLEGGMGRAANLTLMDAGSRPVGAPIPLEVMPGTPMDEDADVRAGRLKPVPGQQVVTMPEPALGLFAIASSGAGGGWMPGTPTFPTTTFRYQPVLEIVREFSIELVNESIVVPAFGRTNTKVGLLRRVRAVPLIIHLEITLVVSVRVFVFRQGNPFTGTSVGGFNEFPTLFPDAFGTYLVFVSASVTVDVGALIALVLPDDTLKPLLMVNVDFGLSMDKRTLTIRGSITLRAHIKSIRPRGGTTRLQLVAPALSDPPLKDPATFFAFYFARAAGRECTEWEFDVGFSNRFLDGSPVEDGGGDQSNVFVVRICSEVAENANLNRLVLTSDPPPVGDPLKLFLDTDKKREAILLARLVPIDKNGNPTGPGNEIKPPAVTFQFVPDVPPPPVKPTDPPIPPVVAITPPDSNNQTRAVAQKIGSGEIQAAVTTGPGMALLPSSVIGFLVTGTGAMALSASLPVIVSVPTAKIKLRFDFKPIQRPELFEPAPDPSALSLTVIENIPDNLPDNITLEIERRVMFFRDPMSVALKGGNVVSGRLNFTGTFEEKIRRFFTGDLVAKKTFKITVPRDKFAGKTAIPLPDMSILANREEKRRLENGKFVYDALVPPGGFTIGPTIDDQPPDGEVGATQVTFEFVVKSKTDGVEIDQMPVPAKLKVEREENHEEYFRVLSECVSARGSSYNQSLTDFAKFLASKPAEQDLTKTIEKLGDDMFRAAVGNVQNGTADGSDRPLYWARLVARVLIKQAFKGKPILTDLLKKLEQHSRGIPMSNFSATDRIKVAILGFDPFELSSSPAAGNPSGLVALYLNGSTKLNLAQKGGAEIPVTIRSCVLPVRYVDFDGNLTRGVGVVEEAIPLALIESADMVLTLSKGGMGRYDIEQSAGKFREPSLTDNLAVKPSPTSKLPDGDEFRFTTLPWQGIVTGGELTRPGPEGPDAKANLIFNQYFEAKRKMVDIGRGDPKKRRSNPGDADAFLETPIDPDEAPLDPRDIRPLPDDTSVYASTGNFLSNEAFYRVAKLRDDAGRGASPRGGKSTLAMGHFHLPDFNQTDDPLRARLFDGATGIIKQMLFDIKRNLLASLVAPFKFQKVVKRTKSNQPLTIPIMVDNRMGKLAFEAKVELAIATPVLANFEPPGLTPNIKIQERKEIMVATVKFKGGARGTYGLACTLRELVNEVPVFRTDVVVKVADPAIATVSPSMGKVDMPIKITGQDFVPVKGTGTDKVDVKIGGVSAKMVMISDDAKTINCRVPQLAPGMYDVELISPHDPNPIKFGTQFMVTA